MNRESIPQTGTTPFQSMLCSNSSSLLPVDQWFLWLLNNHLKVLRFLCNVTISCARVCWHRARVRVAPANGSAHHLRDPRLFCPGCRSSIWISRDRSGDQRNNSNPDIIHGQAAGPVSCNCNYHHHRHRTKNTTSIPPNPSNLQFKPHVSKLTFSGRPGKEPGVLRLPSNHDFYSSSIISAVS